MIKKIDELISLAESGDEKAQFELSCYYHDLVDGDKHLREAIYWLKLSVEKGLAEAQMQLGICYEIGEGVEIDTDKALFWYTKAAEQGLAGAQYCLAQIYQSGKIVGKDIDKAIFWYTKAAEQGLAEAQMQLGVCYETGEGVEKDINIAMNWFTKAAEQGLNKEQRVIEQTNQKIGRWEKISSSYCDTSAEHIVNIQWIPVSENLIAAVFVTNVGTVGNKFFFFESNSEYSDDSLCLNNDINKAIYWYAKLAKNGYSVAQYILGYCYENGNNVQKDIDKAIFWYKKATDQNDRLAQFNLGLMYYNGDVVQKDIDKGLRLLEQSSKNGFYKATHILSSIYEKNGDYLKAKQYLELVIKQTQDNNTLSDAYYRLALFYIDYEKEVKKNLNTAKQYLDKAANYGSDDAEELLKAINHELYIGDSNNNRMGIIAKDLIDKKIPIGNLSKEVENVLKNQFGGMFLYLKPLTKTALITSLLTYMSFMSIGEEKYRELDFSSVINSITKSVEIELKHIFYTRFMEYLENNNIPPTEFDPEKQRFVTEIKNKVPPFENVESADLNEEFANTKEFNYYKQKKYDRVAAIKYVIGENNGAFTLGGIRNYIGLCERDVAVPSITITENNIKTKPYVKKEIIIDKHFLKYIDNVFKDDAFPKIDRIDSIKKYLSKLVKKVSYIAFNLRNPSDHTQIMECWKATHCGNIVFMKDNFLMDFLSKIKPEYL